MDLITRMGGRKFIMAMIAGAFASYLEVSGHGLTPTMAGFLVALVGAFGMANVKATSDYLDSKTANKDSSDSKELERKVDEIHSIAVQTNTGGQTEQFLQILSDLNKNIAAVQGNSGQIAQVLVNVKNDLQAVKRAVGQP